MEGETLEFARWGGSRSVVMDVSEEMAHQTIMPRDETYRLYVISGFAV